MRFNNYSVSVAYNITSNLHFQTTLHSSQNVIKFINFTNQVRQPGHELRIESLSVPRKSKVQSHSETRRTNYFRFPLQNKHEMGIFHELRMHSALQVHEMVFLHARRPPIRSFVSFWRFGFSNGFRNFQFSSLRHILRLYGDWNEP